MTRPAIPGSLKSCDRAQPGIKPIVRRHVACGMPIISRMRRTVLPGTAHQRCWVHKEANVLDMVPESVQPAMKADLREFHVAPTRTAAEVAMVAVTEKYGAKYPRRRLPDQGMGGAAGVLRLTGRALRPPAQLEPDLERVRHAAASVRADQGGALVDHAKLMVFKLVMTASNTWRRLQGKTSCLRSWPASPSVRGPRSPRARITAPPDGLPLLNPA